MINSLANEEILNVKLISGVLGDPPCIVMVIV